MERNCYNPASSLKHLWFWIPLWFTCKSTVSVCSSPALSAAVGIHVTAFCSGETRISTSIKSGFQEEIYYHSPARCLLDAAAPERDESRRSAGCCGSGAPRERRLRSELGTAHQKGDSSREEPRGSGKSYLPQSSQQP